MHHHHVRSLLLIASMAALGPGCDPTPLGGSCSSDEECRPDQRCIDGECVTRPTEARDGGGSSGFDASAVERDSGPPASLESIALSPDGALLVSVDGSMPDQTFEVIGTYSDGSTRAVAGPTFAVDSVSLGTIDVASGRFTANGVIGGSTTVTASVPGPSGEPLTASAALTVRLQHTVVGDGVPADVESRFTATPVDDAARRAQLVYPLDGAVMPQNVYPADMQWLNGAAGDLFRISLSKPSMTVTAYLAHDGSLDNHWLVDEDAWRSLAQTDPDAEATLRVDRLEAASGELLVGAAVVIRFARAALTGAVYYWDIADGQIIRINDGTATREAFMPTPPLDYTGGSDCVGCHAVSPSGRYMAGRLGGGENIGAIFDLTEDLSGNPPPTMFPLNRGSGTLADTSARWWFSSWSPDETRIVASTSEGSARQMVIYDPFTGAQVPVTGTLPGDVTHPAWSPDGTQIAFTSQAGRWGGENVQGNISVIDVTGPDQFGVVKILHEGASLSGEAPGGVTDSYPSWSPDSEWIAFCHGTGSRSDNLETTPVNYSALYLMRRDGSQVSRLARVSPAGQMTEDFQPRFSPFEQGGYYWMSFLSRRDYGNAEVGTRGGRQQIWVTAIRTEPAPGEDPSSVPYWLPGQSTASRNISAYWAPRPCRPDGESCSVGSECCGGDCRPDESGALVCSPPPPDRCRMVNETCSSDEDCCDGLSCFGHVCVRPPE